MDKQKEKIRLLQVTVGFTLGGAERIILDLARTIDRERFEVTVCGLKGWGWLGEELGKIGVEAIALKGRNRFDPTLISKFWRLIKERKVDIIHSHLFTANQLSRGLGRLARVPAIISSHHNLNMGFSHRRLERLTAPLADLNICCSQAVKNFLVGSLGLPESHYRVIYNGIDLDSFLTGREGRWRAEVGVGSSERAVVYIGRLFEPTKGLRDLISAAVEVLRKCPETKFILVGEGPDWRQLRRQAEKLGISRQMIFTGVRKDVAEILSACDIMVLPSRQEGFGIVLLEAMAAGKPVVATQTGGIPEVVEDGKTGLLVPPGNTGELAKAIIYLLNRPEKVREMGEAGRKRAKERFPLTKMTRQMQALYEELWNRKN